MKVREEEKADKGEYHAFLNEIRNLVSGYLYTIAQFDWRNNNG